MTRVTNDVEALYELLRGLGTLIGEFVPFFVALAVMLAIDVQLTYCFNSATSVLPVTTTSGALPAYYSVKYVKPCPP